MIKKLAFIFLFLFLNCLSTQAIENKDIEISNKYFSFIMPESTQGTYSVEKMDNGIYICEKISAKSKMGGFAFGIKIFKYPNEYVDIPNSKKLGELKDTKGTLYDVVLLRPSEIQYEDGEEIQKNYNQLYEYGNNVEIKGINGNKYFKNQGMKGEDLYREILKKYKTAIENNWDSKKFEQENLGYMYPVLEKTNKDLLKKIGYAYYDINLDGIDELFIGQKYSIFDVYTMINRRPEHVISGGDVDKYFISYDSFLCNEYSSKQNEQITKIFVLGQNTTELNPTITFIRNGKSRYFVYGNSNVKEEVSKKLFSERIKMFKKDKLNFIPLSEFE